MSNIFDEYSPYQLRQIFIDKDNDWPEGFKRFVHDEIAYELLESWLESVDPDVYNERVRDIIEQMTYGYKDENGNEMLEFNVENKT